jgi:hypothetical protein
MKTAQNGKGSTPRNLSEKFRKNYSAIKWSKKQTTKGGKLK